MSKVVKKVGRAVKKVVKGVAKVVKAVAKPVVSIVKKVASSKIGRILIGAATIYFGGAAVMGAMKGAAAGSGFMGTLSGAVSGAGTGIANAWSGLTSAASSFMSGNFSQGASALGQGAMGQPVSAVGSQITNAKGLIASQVGEGAIGSAVATPVTGGAVVGTPLPPAGAAAGAATSGAASQGGSWIGGVWDSLGSYGKMAAVQGGMQLAGGLIQGIGAQKQQDAQWNREDSLAEQERQRRESNMSGQFRFGEATDSPYVDQYRQDPNQFTGSPGDNMAGGPRYLQGGLIGGYMPGRRSSLDMFPLYGPRRFA